MKRYLFLFALPLMGGCQVENVVKEVVKEKEVFIPAVEAAIVAGETIATSGSVELGAAIAIGGTVVLALIKLFGKEQ